VIGIASKPLKTFSIDTMSETGVVGFIIVSCVLALIPEWLNYDILSRDGASLYIPVAKLLLEGRVHDALFGVYKPGIIPLYEMSIALISFVTPFDLETSGRLVSVFFFIVGAVGIYKATRIICSDRLAALLSFLFYLSSRDSLEYSTDCLKETLLVAIVVWGNYFLLQAMYAHKQVSYLLGAGLLAVGGLVRSTALIFLLGWVILWVVHDRQRLVVRLTLFLALIGAVIIAVVANEHYGLKLPVLRRSLSLYNLLNFYHAGFSGALEIICVLVSQFMARSYYFILLLALIGMHLLRKNYYTAFYAIVFMILATVAVKIGWHQTARGTDRYIVVFIISLHPMAAYTLSRLLRAGKPRYRYFAILCIFSCIVIGASKVFTPPERDKLDIKEAGRWIASRTGTDFPLVTTDIRVGFYAETFPYLLMKFDKLSIREKIAVRKAPIKRYVRFNGFVKENALVMAVAVDQTELEGRLVKERLESLGITRDNVIGNIVIFIPKKRLQVDVRPG